MSYTPNEQLLADKLGRLIEAIDPVKEAMMARLREQPNTWKEEHLEELFEWVKRLTVLELDAIKLQSEVR